MNITCRWDILLPYQVKFPEGIKQPIVIREVKLFFEQKDDFNRLLVECDYEYDGEYDSGNSDKEIDRRKRFYNGVVMKVGVIVQEFTDSLFRTLDDSCFRLFNGEDFIVPYNMNCEIFSAGYGGDLTGIYTPTFGDIQQAIRNIETRLDKRNSNIDVVKEFIRQSEYFHEVGNFEMAVLNLALAGECFIKKYLNKNSNYYKETEIEFKAYIKMEKLKGIRIENSFVEQYFHFILQKEKNISLKMYDVNSFNALDIIFKCRNAVAHGDDMYIKNCLIESGIKYKNMYNFFGVLHDYLVESINWIREKD
jgi:hypothetical protein